RPGPPARCRSHSVRVRGVSLGGGHRPGQPPAPDSLTPSHRPGSPVLSATVANRLGERPCLPHLDRHARMAYRWSCPTQRVTALASCAHRSDDTDAPSAVGSVPLAAGLALMLPDLVRC